MKRELLGAKLRLQSGMKRLEDLRGVYPDAGPSIAAVLEVDFGEVLRTIDYLLELQ